MSDGILVIQCYLRISEISRDSIYIINRRDGRNDTGDRDMSDGRDKE